MRSVLAEIVKEIETTVEDINGVRVGKLVSVEGKSGILVDYENNPFGALPARTTMNITTGDMGNDVLLLFENNKPDLPIIIGFLQDSVTSQKANYSEEITIGKKNCKNAIVDGERIIFDAKKEIVLRCGSGSITLQKNGKIMVKGTYLISRSSGPNKIKGASVGIN